MSNYKNSVYLGNIGFGELPANPIIIRRMFMRRLLEWDCIVISDTQMLQDPRINHLMSGFTDDGILERFNMIGVEPWQKGFEVLLKSGAVQMAVRSVSNSGSTQSMESVWDEFNSKDHKKAAHLPKNNRYAKYLDKLDYNKTPYNLRSISRRYKNNLLDGVDSGAFKLNMLNSCERRVYELFNENEVRLRDINHYIKGERNNGLPEQRFKQIYDYVHKCYNVNIPAETGCFLEARMESIPTHLPCGTGTFTDQSSKIAQDKLRKTWAFIDDILDLIPFEDFCEIRENINRLVPRASIMKYYMGTLGDEECKSFPDIWAEYTADLEREWRNSLPEVISNVKERELERLSPSQKTVLGKGLELVVSTMGFIPVIGQIAGAAGAYSSVRSFLSIRKDMNHKQSVEKHLKLLEEYTNPDSLIITKYD